MFNFCIKGLFVMISENTIWSNPGKLIHFSFSQSQGNWASLEAIEFSQPGLQALGSKLQICGKRSL